MTSPIGKDTRVVIQGITGKQGTKTCREMIDYGTAVVAGVTPGRGGDSIHGVPVYNTVQEALDRHPEINASLVCVPRDSAKDAAFEAIGSGPIRLVSVLTEGIARQDSARIVQFAQQNGVRVIGPASVGIIAPREHVKIGAIGGNDPGVFYPGHIAIFSKSGGMCLSIANDILNRLGYGTSLVVGIGGDRITGTTFVDLLEMVREDKNTHLVVLMGEVGGTYEEEAAEYLGRVQYPKPVIVRLTGIGAQKLFPKGSRMGHAGAIIGESDVGTYESKVNAFRAVGVPVAETPDDLIEFVKEALPPATAPDFESAVSDNFELVSISKAKLEGLKGEVRAVRVRTAMTRLLDGVPFFRGYALADLVRSASIPQMIWMALKKQDPTEEDTRQILEDYNTIMRELPPGDGPQAAAKCCIEGGGGFQTAVSAGLLATPQPDLTRPPLNAMCSRYTSGQLQALTISAQVVSLVSGILGHPVPPGPYDKIEKSVLAALSDGPPDDDQAELVRAIYVACVDHTPATPSSLAALTSYSGGGSLKTALAAGISAMGDVHAGAGEATAKILRQFIEPFQAAKRDGTTMVRNGIAVTDLDELADFLIDQFSGKMGSSKRKIPGYGHRYYSLYGRDPRAEVVLQVAAKVQVDRDYVKFARRLETHIKHRKSTGLCLNVDGVIGVVLCALGLHPATGKALFIIPRTVGILGQLLEQHEGSFFRLSNDSVIYIGPETGRKFEPKR